MTQNDATLRQIEAADPTQSTWLSANAGSGKTRVLTDRVARLLLNKTRPENVLCLTYTKAAASEMQNRLFKRLGEWAMMPGDTLRKELKEMGASDVVDDGYLRDARKLFAAAIEAPGGLKIQTIHSFCAGILRRFPLEAAVSPQFKEMEDRAAHLLREEVLDDLATGPQADAVAGFARHHSGADLGKFLAAITARKAVFLTPPADVDIIKALDLTQGASPSDAVRVAFIGGEDALVDDLVEACASATKSYQTFAAKLKSLDLKQPTLDTLEQLFSLLLYADKTSKSRNWPQSNHKSSVEAVATVIDDIHAFMDRTAEAYDYLNRIKALEKTRALLAFATPFVQAYERKKLQRAALDFDDLITKAKALLENEAVAQWVLFRLDGGVDHVLVDEAQDTSPNQWDIVRLLTQEFSTGLGANPDRDRTVFVVGDKKQSIYSFQGADPEGFDRMRDHFKTELGKINKPLQDKDLEYSFRSSDAILRLVDQTFRGEMREGLADRISHIAFHRELPGRVDVWPAIAPNEAPEERDWHDPVDLKGRTNNQVVLARQIAGQIKHMMRHDTLPVIKDGVLGRRVITEGDILILVQRRSDLFGEIISACKSEGLEVAGADRLKLGGELAVKDISALLQFLALQDDDLSLAAALRSPLFGWSEQDLYTLAQPRPKHQTLWEALRRSGAHAATLRILDDLRDNADFLRPYDLINRILIRHGGRHALLARLGHEAEDGIDALLSQALGYEQSAVPSLTGFLTWLETEDVTVKRQMDSAGNRIRVMTVHGAKGLESPIVILPDTAKRQLSAGGDILTDGPLAFWKPKSADMPQVLRDLSDKDKEAQIRERRRLLYVAMTRAENWLIVAAAGDVGDDQDSWHATVSTALTHLDAVDHGEPFGTIKRVSRWDWTGGALITSDAPKSVTPARGPFDATLPEIPARRLSLSPSDLKGAKIIPGDTHDDTSDAALAWGRIIHLLLEVLPDADPDNRADYAQTLIANHPDVGLIADPEALMAEALSLLTAPDLTCVFSSGLAEVPICANLTSLSGQPIYGIIDRLIVTDQTVTAIDYKSNRITPDTPDQTPLGLIRQMAAYRDALRLVYPRHKVEVALLWTRTGGLTRLGDGALDAALADVTMA